MVLDATLKELETAFGEWETMGVPGPAPAQAQPPASGKEKEIKEKTKKLLMQLREQLADLSQE